MTFRTSSAIPTSYLKMGQQWKVTCPGDAVAVGSYPLRCDTYYICVKGAFKLKTCPPGYSYDEILKTCRRHETVYCGGRPTIAAAPDMAHGPEHIATFRPEVSATAAASASASAYTPLFWQPAAPTPPLTMTHQMAGTPPTFTTKAPEIVTVDRPHRIDVFVERIQPYLNTIVVDRTRHVTVTRTVARPNFVDIDIEYKRPVVGKVTINRPVPIINTIFVDKKKQVDVILENVRPVVQTLTVEAPVTIERPNIVEKHQNIDVQVDQKTPSAFVSGTVSGAGSLEASVARRPAGFVSGDVGETEAGSRPSIVQGASASAQASAQGSAEASGFFNQGQPSEEVQAARPTFPTLSSQASAQASAQATGFFSQFQQSQDIQAGRRPITQGPIAEEQRPPVTNPSWGEGASLLCTTLRICSYPKLAPHSSFVLGRDGASKRNNEPWYKSATFVPWIEGEERSSQDEERSIGFQRCRIFSPRNPCDQELEATTFFARRIRCCIKPGYSSAPKRKSVCQRAVDKTGKESSCRTGMVAVPFEGHASICCPATVKHKEESHCYKLYDNQCSGRYKPMTLEGESICCGADNRIVEAPVRKKKVHMVRKCYVKRVPAPCHFGYTKKYYKTKSVCCGAPFKRPVQEKWSCKVGLSVCSSGYFKKVCKDTSCCCRTWYDGQSRDNIWDEQVFDDVEEPFGEVTDGDQIPVEDLEDTEEERAIGEDCEEEDRCYKPYRVRRCYIRKHPACRPTYIAKYYHSKAVCCSATYQSNSYEKDVFKKSEVKIIQKWACKLKQQHSCSFTHAEKICKGGSCCCRELTADLRSGIADEEILDDNEVEPAEEYELSDDEIDAKENRSSNDCEEGERCYKPHRVRRCYMRKRPTCRPNYVAKYSYSKAVCCSATYQSSSYEKEVFKKSEVKVVQKWACKLKQERTCSSVHIEKFCKGESCCCRELTDDLRSGITDEEILEDTEVEPAEELEVSDDEIAGLEDRDLIDGCTDEERCGHQRPVHKVRQCYRRPRQAFCKFGFIAKSYLGKRVCCSSAYESKSYEKDIIKKVETKVVEKWRCKIRSHTECGGSWAKKMVCREESCCCRHLTEDLREGPDSDELDFEGINVEPVDVGHELLDGALEDIVEDRACTNGERCGKMIQSMLIDQPPMDLFHPMMPIFDFPMGIEVESPEPRALRPCGVACVRLNGRRICLRWCLFSRPTLFYADQPDLDPASVLGGGVASELMKILAEALKVIDVQKLPGVKGEPTKDMDIVKNDMIQKHGGKYQIPLNTEMGTVMLEVANDGKGSINPENIKIFYAGQPDNDLAGLLGSGLINQITKILGEALKMLDMSKLTGPKQDTDQQDSEESRILGGVLGTLTKLLGSALKLLSGGTRDPMKDMVIVKNDMIQKHGGKYQIPLNTEMGTVMLEVANDGKGSINPENIKIFYAGQPDNDLAGLLGSGLVGQITKILGEALKMLDLSKLTGTKQDTEHLDSEESRILGGVVGTLTKLLGTALRLLSGGILDPMKDMAIVKNDMTQIDGRKFKIPLQTQAGTMIGKVENDGKGTVSIDAKFVTSDGSRAIQMTKSHLKALEPHLSSTGGFEIPAVFVGTTVDDTIDKVSLVDSAPDALVKVAEEIDDFGKSDDVTIPLGALIEMESSLEDAKTESSNWLELE
ncbi:hypothetical protein QYM36_011035 [Artemia franciscana]|uniref:Chitin-binding type-2 domain-containing protein n=1 Tax=Artemia franciscana TaxID=6661 RepID=A0AA88HHR8_ARTSF|nr:hypothetical protein QYM36_011035 [Artemia franciscana]